MGRFSDHQWQRTIPAHFHRPWRAYGINDGYSVEAASHLITSGQQPDFMLIYFPDHDHAMHRKNPAHMRDAMLQLDRHLQTLLHAFGGWRRAMIDTTWILVSDHGQSQIARQAVGRIDLDALLRPLKVMPIYARNDGQYDLAVANNERMAYLYPWRDGVEAELRRRLSVEARFDLVAWKEGAWVQVFRPGAGYVLRFTKENIANERTWTDIYGMKWHICGDWRVLDLKERAGTLEYGDFPDALARLHGALFSQEGPVIVVNARARYEIKTAFYPTHKNGGAHGGLHISESEVPLWVCGSQDVSWISPHPRIVDLKDIILRLLETGLPQRTEEQHAVDATMASS